MKKIIPLLSVGLLLVGCGPDVNRNESLREKVFNNPVVTNATDGTITNYAVRAVYSTRTGGGDAAVDFYPLDGQVLPKGSRNIRYEGGGWYTFLWKGGCYMASLQDSGEGDHNVMVNPAHNKQVCDLSEPKRAEREEFDHQVTQY